MVTAVNNRVRHLLAPAGAGFWQFSPEFQRFLAFIFGLLTGLLLPVVFRTIGHLAR